MRIVGDLIVLAVYQVPSIPADNSNYWMSFWIDLGSSKSQHKQYFMEELGMKEIRVTHTVTQSHIVIFFRSVTSMHVIYTKENSYSSILRILRVVHG